MWNKTKSFFIKSKRVWHTLKKPSKKEFKTIAKVSGIGIALVGVVGFIIGLIMKMFI